MVYTDDIAQYGDWDDDNVLSKLSVEIVKEAAGQLPNGSIIFQFTTHIVSDYNV